MLRLQVHKFRRFSYSSFEGLENWTHGPANRGHSEIWSQDWKTVLTHKIGKRGQTLWKSFCRGDNIQMPTCSGAMRRTHCMHFNSEKPRSELPFRRFRSLLTYTFWISSFFFQSLNLRKLQFPFQRSPEKILEILGRCEHGGCPQNCSARNINVLPSQSCFPWSNPNFPIVIHWRVSTLYSMVSRTSKVWSGVRGETSAILWATSGMGYNQILKDFFLSFLEKKLEAPQMDKQTFQFSLIKACAGMWAESGSVQQPTTRSITRSMTAFSVQNQNKHQIGSKHCYDAQNTQKI